jgi:hypothetical protein
MIRILPFIRVSAIRDALNESDRIDALLGSADFPNDDKMTEEEIDRLHIQQQGAWALVRYLVLEAAETTSYDPPVCVDIGDAVIILYMNQDDGGNGRSMDAGWIASRNIVRPGETPEWALEPESHDGQEAA